MAIFNSYVKLPGGIIHDLGPFLSNQGGQLALARN